MQKSVIIVLGTQKSACFTRYSIAFAEIDGLPAGLRPLSSSASFEMRGPRPVPSLDTVADSLLSAGG